MTEYSRRSFLSGVLTCGALTAAATYLIPSGRSADPVELRLVSGADRTGARDLLLEIWNRSNPDARARVVSEISSGSGDERTKMLAFAENGEADVLNLDLIDVPEFAKQGAIEPMALPEDQEFLTPTLIPSRVPGDPDRYWAAPFNTDVGMLFTRNPEEQGKRRPGMAQVLEKQVAARSRQFVAQLEPGSSNVDESFVVNVLEHAIAADDGLLAQDGTVSYDLDRWQRALRPLRQAIDEEKVTLTDNERDSVTAYASGRRRYMRNWPVYYRELQQVGDVDVRAARVELTPLPIGIVGGQSLALVAGSPHATQARRFIDFLTDEPAQKILAAHGFAPTRIGAYNDANLKVLIPHLSAVRKAVEEGRLRPINPNYRRFASAVRRHADDLLYNRSELTSEFIADIKSALGD